MNTVFQRCVNYALKKVCFHNTPWCVNLHTPKTHLIMCYFKDKRCIWRTHHGVFWEHTCFYSASVAVYMNSPADSGQAVLPGLFRDPG